MARKKKSVVISFERSISSHLRIVAVFVIISLLLSIPFFLSVFKNQQAYVSPYHKEKLTIPPHAHYVPHQLIIKYRSGMSPNELKSQIAHENGIIKLITSLSGAKTPNDELVHIRQTLIRAGVVSETQMFGKSMPDYYVLSLKQTQSVADSQKILNNADFIDFAQPNYVATPQKTPNDPYYHYQWSLQSIHAPQAWDITTGSSAVKVAVLDSGVDSIHQDLIGNIIPDHDYVYNQNASVDVEGHGTFVSGIIGAVGNNNTGVTGVSWNVSIYDEKICDNEKQAQCSEDASSQAIIDAANNGMKAVNMSIATAAPAEVPCSQAPLWQDAINYAVNHGTLVVAAAGNDNRDVSVVSPASCQNVIVVGATGPQNERANYSNYGNITIAAPGGDPIPSNPNPICNPTICITSTTNTGSYDIGVGTSFASPQVVGVIALLYSQYPELSASQIRQCLLTGADPITTDQPLSGRFLDAYGALKACENVKPITPSATPTPTALPPTPTVIQSTITPPAQNGYSISGTVFLDDNNNQHQDAGEKGYQGAQVKFNNGTVLFTDSTGYFSLNNVSAGNYSFQITINGKIVGGWSNPLNQNLYITFPISSNFFSTSTQVTPIVATVTPILQTGTPTPPTDQGGQGDQSGQIPTAIPTITSPPAILYDCKPYTSQKIADGKEITITQLQCSPL